MAVEDVLARSRMLVDLCRDDEAEPLLAQASRRLPKYWRRSQTTRACSC
ncbi:MAG TPA: hypothetical protein VF223_20720 [Trebonia sp.]